MSHYGALKRLRALARAQLTTQALMTSLTMRSSKTGPPIPTTSPSSSPRCPRTSSTLVLQVSTRQAAPRHSTLSVSQSKRQDIMGGHQRVCLEGSGGTTSSDLEHRRWRQGDPLRQRSGWLRRTSCLRRGCSHRQGRTEGVRSAVRRDPHHRWQQTRTAPKQPAAPTTTSPDR